MSDDRTTMRREPASMRSPSPTLLLYFRDGVKVVPLRVGEAIIVGRSYPADAVVDDRSLSRQHVRFTVDEVGVGVEDLESTNGTWINGERVTKARASFGDVVRIGDVVASLHIVPAGRTSTANVEGHDRFMSALEDEVRRAHTFARPVAVVMIAGEHVSQWTQAVAAALRPADRIGLYADDTALVMLPELGQGAALARAKELAEIAGAKRVGLAVLPDDAASADELVSMVRASLVRGLAAQERAPSVAPPSMVVQSERMHAVLDEVARVAPSTLSVLLHGETGTGKELVARAIHDASPRKSAPLRSINCGAIPQTLVEGMLFGHERGAFTSADRTTKGIFEQAHTGTVFLDEIGELSPTAQAAVLRVLESKKIMRIGGDREIDVDVRLVAATHRDLEVMCDAGTFRRDLLYRLNAVVLELPPLRERTGEIEPLAQAFLADANASSKRSVRGFDAAALDLVMRWPWPGNVRELKNAVERAVVIARCDVITEADLPARMRAPVAIAAPPQNADPIEFKERVKQLTRNFESDVIVQALQRAGGNQTEAARLLKMPIRTLAHKIKELGIKKSFT